MPALPQAPRFVFAVAGAAHAAKLAPALGALGRATAHEILVVQRAGDPPAPHPNRLEAEPPAGLSDHQAAIWLKTGLHRLVGLERPFCYLDSDVLALGPGIEAIFGQTPGPLAFAPDHATLDQFSPYAVRCGCRQACGHLREALFCQWGVDVAGDFRLWNGGVFVARAGAEAVLDEWHKLATQIFAEPYWFTRDQAALAAAVWRAGWQARPTLPPRFNLILDCCRGIAPDARATTPPDRLSVTPRHLPLPKAEAVHLINNGVGRTGWPHWDHLARFLELSP
ncbi:hypothetical protein [Acidocella sp.]|uniref:hypothetical protein n=1 Tax=Acidocella sp. TaxID=50710 RepID=UPI00263A1F66|nr:hypothetical protein [Acidocella sp.]